MTRFASISLAASIAAIAAASPAYAADALVTFSGNIVPSTCTISGGGAAENTSPGNLHVEMPNVGLDDLGYAGDTAGQTSFQIQVGQPGETGCKGGPGGTVSLHFIESEAPIVTAGNGRLANVAGNAKNVQVELLDADTSNAINLRNGANVPIKTLSNNQAVFDFIAQYVAVGGAAEAGTVSTYATVEATYQ